MLMMYRHGLRVSEALRLRRDDVNLDQAWLWVERAKNGLSVEHSIWILSPRSSRCTSGAERVPAILPVVRSKRHGSTLPPDFRFRQRIGGHPHPHPEEELAALETPVAENLSS
jgi:integrase